MNIDLRLGNCLDIMAALPENSVDTIITDPPYHLTSITKRFGGKNAAPAQFGTDGAFARASKGFMGKPGMAVILPSRLQLGNRRIECLIQEGFCLRLVALVLITGWCALLRTLGLK